MEEFKDFENYAEIIPFNQPLHQRRRERSTEDPPDRVHVDRADLNVGKAKLGVQLNFSPIKPKVDLADLTRRSYLQGSGSSYWNPNPVTHN